MYHTEENIQFNSSQFIILSVIAAMVAAPLVIVLMVVYMINTGECECKKARYYCYTAVAVVLGLVNTTKPVDVSDLGFYYWLYNFVDEVGTYRFISLIPKEPLYYIFTLVGNWVTFGSFKLFLIITTVFMYLPVMAGFDIIIRKATDIPVRYAVMAAVMLALFSEYFFYTAQIVRQVLAGSVAFYCLAVSVFCNRRWALAGLVAAGFIHASAFLFSVYLVFYFTRRWKLWVRISLMVAMMLSLTFLLNVVAGVTETDSTVGYAAQRGIDGAEDLKIKVGLFPLLVSCSVAPMSAFIMYRFRNDVRIVSFFLMPVLLVVFILANQNSPLFVLRFMEYTYMYIPICVTLTLCLAGLRQVVILLDFVMAVRFYVRLNGGGFDYLPARDWLWQGAISYFL